MAIHFALPQAHIVWNFLARSEGSGWKCTTKAVSEPALSQPQRLRCRRFLQHSARTTSPASVMPRQPLRSSFSRRVHPLARSYKDASVNRVPLERSRVLRSCQWAPIASIAGSTRYTQRRRLQLCRLKKWGATDCTSLLTLRPHLLVSLIPSSGFSPQFMPYLHCLLLEGATLRQEKKKGEVADHEKESSWMPVEMDCRQLEHTPVATTTVRWSTRARIWTNNSGGSSCHLSSTFSKTPPASSTTSGQSVAWIIRFNLFFTPGGADSISSSSDAQKNEEGPDLWSDSPLAFFFSSPNSSTSLSPRSRGWQSAGIS